MRLTAMLATHPGVEDDCDRVAPGRRVGGSRDVGGRPVDCVTLTAIACLKA